jgi:uncharacterized membrane protein YjgN (DUF898 family)
MNVAIEATPSSGAPQSAELVDETPQYTGTAGAILGIVLSNALITPFTFGFYRFWGKTRLRRYLWNAVRFKGDPFEYTGRGGELLIGFLIATGFLLALFAVTAAGMYAAGGPQSPGGQAIQTGIAFAFLFLINVALYRVRRYQMSRTLWRGVRFGQTGSSFKYAVTVFGWYVLRAITLNLIAPWANTALQRYRIANTCFGSIAFSFDARGRPLFGRWLLTWLLFIPTLGLVYFWYQAAQQRHFYRHTRVSDVQFESTIGGGALLGLFMLYVAALAVIVLIIAVVLGTALAGQMANFGALAEDPNLAMPILLNALPQIIVAVLIWYFASRAAQALYLIHRPLALVCRTTRLKGRIDFAAIAQSAQTAPRFGEGLANALDIGGV